LNATYGDAKVKDGKIRVGLLGANPEKGWGTSVHVPAIAALPSFVLEATGTTRQETAEASAKLFGARLAFGDAQALISHPDVDLVSITVKAPEHYRFAMMALEAGKHVYCEWPLAVSTAQAAAMRDLAASRGLKTAVGLQSRLAPAIMRAHDLLRDGYIGRLTAARMVCSLPGGGGRRSAEGLYVIDKVNGASTLNIQGGHAIDALRYVAGPFAGLSALVLNQFDQVEVIETGEVRPKDAPDQVIISGKLAGGAGVSVMINGGAVAGHGIEMKFFGTEGTISVSAQGGLNFQMSELVLQGARRPERQLQVLDIPPGYDPGIIPAGFKGRPPYPGVDVPRATIVNVTNLYQRLGQAILEDSPMEPDFATGVSMHELIDAIERASEAGIYQTR
jgi:predicted dehydrogenase